LRDERKKSEAMVTERGKRKGKGRKLIRTRRGAGKRWQKGKCGGPVNFKKGEGEGNRGGGKRGLKRRVKPSLAWGSKGVHGEGASSQEGEQVPERGGVHKVVA